MATTVRLVGISVTSWEEDLVAWREEDHEAWWEEEDLVTWTGGMPGRTEAWLAA